MKKIGIIIAATASFLTSSCEEVVDLDLDQYEKRVVIDANLFVGEPEYNRIKLYYSAPFYADTYNYITTAQVQIKDIDTDELYVFSHTANGTYTNPLFVPEIGATYELEIQYDGNTYKGISSVYEAPEIINVEQINDAGFLGDSYEIRFYYQDKEETEDYYLMQTKDSEQNSFSLGNDQFTNGNLTYDLYFADKEQKGEEIFFALTKIDKAYYNYLNKMFSNAASAGNPFATPTGTLKGNIINTTDSNDFPLGYFHIAQRNTTTYTIQ